MTKNADFWIDTLGLEPHPEGGYYREVFRSGEKIDKDCLPDRFTIDHNIFTSIYFLLESGDYSAFHRLKADEIWIFLEGAPLEIFVINNAGILQKKILGNDPDHNEDLQVLMQAETWFAVRPTENESYTLCCCIMAPGFEFSELELGDKDELIKTFPQHKKLFDELC